jgi:hypothetical protein
MQAGRESEIKLRFRYDGASLISDSDGALPSNISLAKGTVAEKSRPGLASKSNWGVIGLQILLLER